MSLPLHPDAVSRMFMLTAMQKRRKADSEPVDAEIEHAESDTRDEKPSSNEAQADGP